MIKEFVEKWDKNKDKLEDFIKTHKQDDYYSYEDLVKLLFNIIINANEEREFDVFDTDNIITIDDGNYQGTQIFILHKNSYQPIVKEYVYTSVYYGSCSGCDTLQFIQSQNYGYDIPTENQVKDYMTLCLHLLQKCHYMQETSDNDE
jgi:hypothetical protein